MIIIADDHLLVTTNPAADGRLLVTENLGTTNLGTTNLGTAVIGRSRLKLGIAAAELRPSKKKAHTYTHTYWLLSIS